MNNFLIIRLSSLGDIIHTLPAFSALRKKFPESKISWVVEEKGKDILDLVPRLDRIITIRPAGWRIQRKDFWTEISGFKEKSKESDQIALDFQGLIKSALLAFLSRAPKRVGFHRRNCREPLASLLYTERLRQIPEDIHVIRKNLMLLTCLGIEEKQYEFPLSLSDELQETIQTKLKKIGYDRKKKLILFNVGATWKTKRWFPDRWIRVIQKLERKDLFALLLWGTEEEKQLALEINSQVNIPLAPFLSLPEVMALVKKATLLISGDTFALQVACAFSRPVVGIFGPTNPRRNGPFGFHDKVAFHELQCSYCYKRSCSSLECLKAIQPDEVAQLSLEILEKYV